MRMRKVGDLPSAVGEGGAVERRLAGHIPVVFLDYDGVLTPIVDRPEDAVMSDDMRITLRELATRCSVCIITGRDRAMAQQLMGVDDLVVAGSHGFDIWTPQQGSISDDRVSGFLDLIAEVTDRLRDDVGSIPGCRSNPSGPRWRCTIATLPRGPRPRRRQRADPARRELRPSRPHAREDGLRAQAQHRLGQG